MASEMPMSDLITLQNTRARKLLLAFSAGKALHAYALVSQQMPQARALAMQCAQAAHCQGAQKPCGVCAACVRFVSGNHPDHIELTPMGKKSIGVEDIRALRENLDRVSWEGGAKTVIFFPAETMTPQAQNALLKTLEEPKGHVVFFLIAGSQSALLPTILSRVQLLPLTFGEEAQYTPLHDEVLALFTRVKAISDIANAAAPFAQRKEESEGILHAIEQLYCDLLRLENGGDELLSAQRREALSSIALFTKGTNQGMMEKTQHARRRMKSNVSWALVLEELLFAHVGGIDDKRRQRSL